MNTHRASPRVAVVGSGISGLTAAYVLRDSCDVTVFEADSRLGGHAHTHTVADDGVLHRVDSGFIVHNDRTYPHLRRLFAELGIDVRECEMSMSVHCDGCGLEYAGGRGLRGVFAQKRRLFDRKYLSMLMSVKRFQKAALAHLDHPTDTQLTYGQFLAEQNFSAYFVAHYAIPIVACVWSSGDAEALGYPAGHLFEFLKHHGFLQLKGSPQWLTVVGGSGSYVDKLVATIGDVRKGFAVTSISRESDGVHVVDSQGATHTFDRVVIATHADQAFTLLADPTPQEKDILGAFGYSVNETVLHRDGSLLPDAKGARSAWNYHLADCHTSSPRTTVTYWMNRLQGITSSKPFLVTLNAAGAIAAQEVVSTMRYTHPIFDTASVAVQPQLKSLFTDQTVYAGAYHGWGFHEDGCRSGVQAAAAWGVEWE